MRLLAASFGQCLLLAVLFVRVTLAQGLSWVRYPTQVITGQSYPVEWEPRGVPVTVQILKGGQYQSTVFYSPDGSTTNFNWNVEDDLDAGSDYLLQVVPANGGQLLSSGTVWVIGDEDGLVVDGRTITASVPDGPSAATPTTAGSVGSGTFPVTADNGDPAPTDAVRTLTYVSGTNTYTQTITLATSTATDSANDNYDIPRGLTGGEIAGIVIGVVAGIVLIILLVWFLRRKQRQRKATAAGLAGTSNGEKDDASISGTTANDIEGNRNTMMSGTSELAGSDASGLTPVGGTDKKHYTYLPYRVPRSEMDGSSSRFEMPGPPAPAYELPAEEVRRGPQVPSTCVPLNPDASSDSPVDKAADKSEVATEPSEAKSEKEEAKDVREVKEVKEEDVERSSSPKPVRPIEPDA